MNRVYCLYRVSDRGQVEKNDIPMQRIACRAFAECHSWEIVQELTEKGISGYKRHMEERDAIVQIKEAAILEKFDILLVFMFDRIGRRDDETPFVVEWLVKHGISVWSVCEGEQRFDNHVDKLTNYIRYWQAAGESERISERTKTRIRQLTNEGHFTGGACPYGYQLIRQGRENKRKQPLYDLVIHPDEAPIIKFIFEKMALEGYGVYRLAKLLNEKGYYPKSGKPWVPISLYGILRNPIYMGVLHKGDISCFQEHLQIITSELFHETQELHRNRAANQTSKRTIPCMQGALLSGFLYCGTCGSRLSSNHIIKHYCKKDGTITERRVQRYYCPQRKDGQSFTCIGQHTYVAEKVDTIFHQQLAKQLSILNEHSPAELAEKKCKALALEIESKLKSTRIQHRQITEEIKLLQAEILACLKGTSFFKATQIRDMLTCAEQSQASLVNSIRSLETEQAALSQTAWEFEVHISKYKSLLGEYASATLARKKIILSHFVQQVKIVKGYKLQITLNKKFAKLFCLA